MHHFKSTLDFDSGKVKSQTIHNWNLRRWCTWYSRWLCGVKDKSFHLEFSQQFMSFWIKTRIECPVISDLAVHQPLAFCTTYLCDVAFSKLIIIKSKKRSFEKCWEYPPSLVDLHQSTNRWTVYKLWSASIPLVVLDNSYKLNFFFKYFFAWLFFTWWFYYCTVTFEDCVHLHDLATDKNASWDL